jgi:hypothetical protein
MPPAVACKQSATGRDGQHNAATTFAAQSAIVDDRHAVFAA